MSKLLAAKMDLTSLLSAYSYSALNSWARRAGMQKRSRRKAELLSALEKKYKGLNPYKAHFQLVQYPSYLLLSDADAYSPSLTGSKYIVIDNPWKELYYELCALDASDSLRSEHGLYKEPYTLHLLVENWSSEGRNMQSLWRHFPYLCYYLALASTEFLCSILEADVQEAFLTTRLFMTVMRLPRVADGRISYVGTHQERSIVRSVRSIAVWDVYRQVYATCYPTYPCIVRADNLLEYVEYFIDKAPEVALALVLKVPDGPKIVESLCDTFCDKLGDKQDAVERLFTIYPKESVLCGVLKAPTLVSLEVAGCHVSKEDTLDVANINEALCSLLTSPALKKSSQTAKKAFEFAETLFPNEELPYADRCWASSAGRPATSFYARKSVMSNLEAVRFLIEELNGNTEAVDSLGYTAVHWCAWNGTPEIFEYLRSKGANVFTLSRNSRTVLHKAAQHGDVTMVKHLMMVYSQAQGWVNSCQHTGETPFELAVKRKDQAIVTTMVEEAARYNLRLF